MREIINILLATISWLAMMALLINIDKLMYTIGPYYYILVILIGFVISCVITGSAVSFIEEES